jgi:hypothetical protein
MRFEAFILGAIAALVLLSQRKQEAMETETASVRQEPEQAQIGTRTKAQPSCVRICDPCESVIQQTTFEQRPFSPPSEFTGKPDAPPRVFDVSETGNGFVQLTPRDVAGVQFFVE